MFFQNWILPLIIGILFLAFGIVWSLRLKKAQALSALAITNSTSHPAWLNKPVYALMFISGGVMLMSWLSFQNILLSKKGLVLFLMLLGFVPGLMGILTSKLDGLKHRLEQSIQHLAEKLNITPFQAVLLPNALLFALLAAVSNVYGLNPFSQSIATLCWGLGVASATLGGWPREHIVDKPFWKTVLSVVILIGFAFLLRGTNTNRVPVALTGDEGDFGTWAYQFYLGNANNLFAVGSHAFPTLYLFIQSIFIGLLGPTSQAIRIPSAIIGALTVGGVYLLGKTMFNHQTGLFAGIFLAFFHFHIHFSRMGLNNIWDGMWYVVVIGALWQGWQTGRRPAFLLAGLGLGFAQYFYASARVLPVILLAWICLLARTDRPRFRRILPDLSLLFFTALIVILPLALFYLVKPNEFIAPIQHVTIFGSWLEEKIATSHQPAWSILLNQLKLGFLAYTNIPISFFYDPGTPVLRLYSVPLFLFGLVLLFWSFRKPQTWVFYFWLTGMALLGAFSAPTPSAQRYIAAAPACAILIGFGIAKGLEWIKKLPPLMEKGLGALIILIVLFISMEDATFYFLDFIPRNYIHWEGDVENQQLAEQLREIPGDWKLIYVEADQENYLSNSVMRYLNPHLKDEDFLPLEKLNLTPLQDHHLVFVFLPGEEVFLRAVQQLYPNGQLFNETGLYSKTIYWLYDYTP